jgi:regulator of nucleoside diphosphate kinase
MPKKNAMRPNQRKGIYITESDFVRLDNLLLTRALQNDRGNEHLHDLRRELDCAIVVHVNDIPPDVVTMNSRVFLTNVDTGDTTEWSLVFPDSADVYQQKISILAPAGTAIFGRRAGDIVEVKAPSGSMKMKVDSVIARSSASSIPVP